MTRDDIKRACEAVGWGWSDDLNPGSALPGAAAIDLESRARFASWEGVHQWDADALALLEATGEDFEIAYHGGRWTAGIIYLGEQWIEDTLPEAAVRAVLAWEEGES